MTMTSFDSDVWRAAWFIFTLSSSLTMVNVISQRFRSQKENKRSATSGNGMAHRGSKADMDLKL